MAPETFINASLCPLCGQGNQCAMELGKTQGTQPTACWCASVKIDAALLEKMPPAARGVACICPPLCQPRRRFAPKTFNPTEGNPCQRTTLK